jgi:hypothetical protein
MRPFNIRGLMSVILGLAVAFAALRNADVYWSGGLLIVNLILMGTAILAVVYERGQSQAGWLGFLVFGGAYLALSIGQLPSAEVSAKLPTTRFITYAHARVETVGRLRGKLVFQIVDRATGTTTFDEAAIQADSSQIWKAILPGAVDYQAFSVVAHCLLALLAGLLGAAIARRYQARQSRASGAERRAERPCITTPADQHRADQASIRNPFAARWFGSPSNRRVRQIDGPLARILKLGSHSARGARSTSMPA